MNRKNVPSTTCSPTQSRAYFQRTPSLLQAYLSLPSPRATTHALCRAVAASGALGPMTRASWGLGAQLLSTSLWLLVWGQVCCAAQMLAALFVHVHYVTRVCVRTHNNHLLHGHSNIFSACSCCSNVPVWHKENTERGSARNEEMLSLSLSLFRSRALSLSLSLMN